MKYRSEFKHGFTNSDYLHFAILKALHSFQVKRDQKKRVTIVRHYYGVIIESL